MNIEQIKKALALLRKKEWEACDYASNANEAANILEQVLKQPEPEPDYYGLTAEHLWMSISKTQYDKLKPEYRMACYTSPPKREPLTDRRWAVFCGICRKEWFVPYQHPGKSVCDQCVSDYGIKGDAP